MKTMLSALLTTWLAACLLAASGALKCPENHFACWNGNCIKAEQKCNGFPDCGDNSDEIFESCFNNTCDESHYQCNYGACVHESLVCNQNSDCLDNSDESPFLCGSDLTVDKLYTDLLGSCSEEYAVECSEKAASKCLKPSQICDGNFDCSTGIDESTDLCSFSRCPLYSFRCKNGACVSKNSFCNRQVDCSDGSDEIPELCYVPEVHINRKVNESLEPIPVTPRPTATCRLPSIPGMRVTDYFAEFSYRPNSELPLRTVVYIGCEPGYSNVESGFSKCGEDGWSTNFSCMRVCNQCIDELNVRYTTQCISQEELTDCKEDIQLLDTTMLVTCAPGYKSAHDPNQVGRHVCNETGLWLPIDANPKCEAVCGIKSTHHPNITPWTVSIFQRISAIEDSYEFKCSGTILSPYIVLTAASCFSDYLSDSHLYFSVVEGDHRVSYRAVDEHGYKLHNISDIHPVSYQRMQKVALLNLVKPFIFGAKVRPICLETIQTTSGVVVESKGDYSNYTTGQGVTVMNDEKYTLTHLVVSSEMSYDIKAFATAIVNDIAKSESIP